MSIDVFIQPISLKTTLNCEVQVTVNGSSENALKVAPWTPVRVDISLPEKKLGQELLCFMALRKCESLADKIVDEFAEFLMAITCLWRNGKNRLVDTKV